MKQFLYGIVCFLTTFPATAQQNAPKWEWLNPRPAGYDCIKIHFSDPEHGFLFNNNGDFITTTDGGNTWSIQQHFPKTKSMDLHDSTGIIAGFSNTLYITNDNGVTWTKKQIEKTENPYYSFVQVISRDTVLALNSNYLTLYRSTDRGNTWTPIQNNTSLNYNNIFYFVNSRIGFKGDHGKIYRTTDGGASWQLSFSGPAWTIISLRFYNEYLGFAYSEEGVLLKTTDGGWTWSGSSQIPFDLNSFFFVNDQIIYAAGEQGTIYKTINGGANWNIISPSSQFGGFSHQSIYFHSADKGFVVGTAGRILSTTDGGISWQQHAPTHFQITSLHLKNRPSGFATDWVSVYKTSDDGQTWQYANLTLQNTYSRLTNSWFINKDTGFVVSENPVWFYKTKNGGVSWEVHHPFPWTFEKVRDMHFSNDTVGVIALANGASTHFFKTIDGGNSWQTLGYQNFILDDFEFVNGSTGFGVSDHGVYKTTDSARTWEILDDNQYIWLNGIHFLNETTGYIFGDNGLLKKTTDGGQTWISLPAPYGHYNKAAFFNEMVGYLSSETYEHGLLKTYDGGATWHRSFNWPQFHLVAAPDTLMYIAGYGGSILRQNIKGYHLDSAAIKNITHCSAIFSATASVAFGSIDGLWLEYGENSFTNRIALSPFSVTNGSVKIVLPIQNLAHSTSYVFRLRGLYEGNFIYSDEHSFETPVFDKPAIYIYGDSLYASRSENIQWFLNGQLMAGVSGRIIKAATSGNYTIRYIESGCNSPMSNPVSIDLQLKNSLTVFPNPVSSNLHIKHQSATIIDITISDSRGSQILTRRSNESLTILPLANFPHGIYFVTIYDRVKKETVTKKVFKW